MNKLNRIPIMIVSVCATLRPVANYLLLKVRNLKNGYSAIPILLVIGSCATEPVNYPELPPEKLSCDFENSQIFNSATADEVNKHIIVHREADSDKSVSLEKSGYRDQFKEVLSGYASFVEKRARQGKQNNRMALLVNGGLNSPSGVKNRASNQIECMKQDGIYPVFLIWSSGLASSYWEQRTRVKNGLYEDNIQFFFPFRMLSDLASSAVRALPIWKDELDRFSDAVLKEEPEYSIESYLRTRTDNKSSKEAFDYYLEKTKDDNVLFLPRGDKRNLNAMKVARYTVVSPARFLMTPLLEDAGRVAWNSMIRRTRLTIRLAGEFQPELWEGYAIDDRPVTALMREYPNGLGEFSRFLADLNRCLGNFQTCGPKFGSGIDIDLKKKIHCALIDTRSATSKDGAELCPQEYGSHRGLKITPIGHSMGAIVLNELLQIFPETPLENIVFMGGADSIGNTRIALMRILAQPGNKDVHFYNLMLHPKSEAREDSVFGLLPSGSLLEWIDQVLQRPYTATDRTVGKWRNIRRAKRSFPFDLQRNMTFHVYGYDINGTAPYKHGAFNETKLKYWCPTFWGPKRERDKETFRPYC
jgi:hypothetical protein